MYASVIIVRSALVRFQEVASGQFSEVLVALNHCRPSWAEPCHTQGCMQAYVYIIILPAVYPPVKIEHK